MGRPSAMCTQFNKGPAVVSPSNNDATDAKHTPTSQSCSSLHGIFTVNKSNRNCVNAKVLRCLGKKEKKSRGCKM